MEKGSDLNKTALIKEVTQGIELVTQLRDHIDPSTPIELLDHFVEKILSSYQKLISMATPDAHHAVDVGNRTPMNPSLYGFGRGGCSSGSSPRSESSHQEYNGHCPPPSKKRKTMPRWVNKVKVSSQVVQGLDGQLDDGFSWRKYGQKDILGSIYPRGYYRCTHRHSQGCLATKQVQKSDEDPTIFHVIYRGHHTCNHRPMSRAQTQAQVQTNSANNKPSLAQLTIAQQEHYSKPNLRPQDLIFKSEIDPTVKLEDPDSGDPYRHIFRCFSFSSALPDSCDMEGYMAFSDLAENSTFVGGDLSPTTSESGHFLGASCRISGTGACSGLNVQTSESDFNEAISGPNSVTGSPIGDFEFSLDQLGIDPNFSFEDPELFS